MCDLYVRLTCMSDWHVDWSIKLYIWTGLLTNGSRKRGNYKQCIIMILDLLIRRLSSKPNFFFKLDWYMINPCVKCNFTVKYGKLCSQRLECSEWWTWLDKHLLFYFYGFETRISTNDKWQIVFTYKYILYLFIYLGRVRTIIKIICHLSFDSVHICCFISMVLKRASAR